MAEEIRTQFWRQKQLICSECFELIGFSEVSTSARYVQCIKCRKKIQNQSKTTCPKCQSKMIIEIQTEFEVEETGEDTGLLPAYECHDCKHIWPKVPSQS